MTSANASGEPMIIDNDEARRKLVGVADGLLLHDRPIHARCDDSVVRLFRGEELPVRRSRGYAPFPVTLPAGLGELPPILAVGGELKSTFCLAQGRSAFLSQHIGDMENLETLAAFDEAVAHFQRIFRIDPTILACDRHPGYLSGQWAAEKAGEKAGERPLVRVQHHHAHVAACMAEHGLDGREPVLGLCFDGTGYGDDAAIWGGEIFLADYRGYQRLAHLAYVPLPGGDAAVRRPYRMALAHLWAAGVEWEEDLPCVRAVPPQEVRVLARQLERGLNTVPTSSMGRLFDAAASLLGLRHQISYEAQAAIELESLARQAGDEAGAYPVAWAEGGEIPCLDPAPLWAGMIRDLRGGVALPVMAARFHNSVAEMALSAALRARQAHPVDRVVLSGGVFQNVTLLTGCVDRLTQAGFHVLTHRLVPPNDGGLALGQAAVAAGRIG
jgi:hydrogenase maturation protein HypF